MAVWNSKLIMCNILHIKATILNYTIAPWSCRNHKFDEGIQAAIQSRICDYTSASWAMRDQTKPTPAPYAIIRVWVIYQQDIAIQYTPLNTLVRATYVEQKLCPQGTVRIGLTMKPAQIGHSMNISICLTRSDVAFDTVRVCCDAAGE